MTTKDDTNEYHDMVYSVDYDSQAKSPSYSDQIETQASEPLFDDQSRKIMKSPWKQQVFV